MMVSCEYLEPLPNDPNTPDTPNNEEPSNPDSPDSPDSPDDPNSPDDPKDPGSPDEPTDPDSPGDPNEPAKTELIIEGGDVIPVAAIGGAVEIKYEIVNPIEGVEVEAKADVDWIVDLAVADSVTFNVLSNDGEQREGVVTLTYGELESVVKVKQTAVLEEGVVRLTVTSEQTSVYDAKGGVGTIIYLLECDDASALPTVETDVNWIVLGEVEAGKVEYEVNYNLVEESRTGHIVLSYDTEMAQITVEQSAANFEPILTVSESSVYINNSIQFMVSYADMDVTAEAVIKEYNTNEIVSATYTPTQLGDYVFYAEYNGRRSASVEVHVIPTMALAFPEDTNPDSYDFNQRILIVDHTGVGCPNCPDVKQAIKNAESKAQYKDKFNVVYSYSYYPSEVCYSAAAKVLWYYYVNVCASGNELTGYPSFTTNYCFNYIGRTNIEQRIDEFWVKNPSASLALAAKMTDDKVIVSASVKSSVSQNIKISLWVLEDDVYAKQSGTSETWMNYHHSVARNMLTKASYTDISGDDFGYVEANTTLSRVLEYDNFVANSWNKDNLKLIAIISAPNSKYGGKYEVVTTVMCDFGESVGFDYKQ